MTRSPASALTDYIYYSEPAGDAQLVGFTGPSQGASVPVFSPGSPSGMGAVCLAFSLNRAVVFDTTLGDTRHIPPVCWLCTCCGRPPSVHRGALSAPPPPPALPKCILLKSWKREFGCQFLGCHSFSSAGYLRTGRQAPGPVLATTPANPFTWTAVWNPEAEAGDLLEAVVGRFDGQASSGLI